MNVTPKLLARLDAATADGDTWTCAPWAHAKTRHPHPSRFDIILFVLRLLPHAWHEAMIGHLADCEHCRDIHDCSLPAVVRMQTRERHRRHQRQSKVRHA